jgi:hypothetical protein
MILADGFSEEHDPVESVTERIKVIECVEAVVEPDR